MASAADGRRVAAGLLAVLVTALLVWFGTGLTPAWPLMWLAPIPVLLFAARASWRSAALVAFLAWFLGSLNLWHYFVAVLRLPPPILAAIFTTPAVMFALAVLLHRALLRRGAPVPALLAFPALWVSFEYLLNVTSPHATAGNLAYTQLELLPLLQLASLTGPWGISFLLMLFSSAVAVAAHLGATAPGRARRLVAAAFGVIALALAFGAVRLARPDHGAKVKVGLLAADPPASPQVAEAGAPTERLLRVYADRAARLAAQGAQVVVMPEKIGVVVDPDATEDAVLQSLADRTRATMVVGLVHVAPPVEYNQARIYRPRAPVRSYDKEHMLPPFESKFKPGTALAVLPGQTSGSWGVAICKDMDFTPLGRRYGSAGVGLLLVPAWDFGADRWSHGHMAVMRGVESGFAVARAAKHGYLTVSDDRGRVLAETASGAAPVASLLAEVPAAHEPTLYLRAGDWFAWLTLALLAFTLARCRAYVLPLAE